MGGRGNEFVGNSGSEGSKVKMGKDLEGMKEFMEAEKAYMNRREERVSRLNTENEWPYSFIVTVFDCETGREVRAEQFYIAELAQEFIDAMWDQGFDVECVYGSTNDYNPKGLKEDERC